MRKPRLAYGIIGGLVVAAALAAACGSGNTATLSSDPGADGAVTPLGDAGEDSPFGDGINGTGVGAGTGTATGLPCDLQQLLENRCIGCHLGPSPAALLTTMPGGWVTSSG